VLHAFVMGICACVPAHSYSVLAHEAIVDALWDVRIKPLLLARYPGSTADELRRAHGYAYGGAIIQDMGYYPFGNKFFSDLTHYVRSGDFVTSLIADSASLDDLAFALGALSHYVSDDNGHPLGTNKAVPLLYPKLRKQFGDVITFEDDPVAHVKTEFGFDVLEVAKGHFAPAAYHDFIGFEVATPLLAKAFRETYSLELADLFDNLELAVGSYRRAISKTIPLATKIAWAQRKDEIQKSQPGMTRGRFRYILSRASYQKQWGEMYERPGVWASILAVLLKLIPKIGPLHALSFHMPTPEAEQLFMSSFNISVVQMRAGLDTVSQQTLSLPDTNFDTGKPIEPAAYQRADKTYAELTTELARKKFSGLDRTTKSRILSYYKNLDLLFATKKNKKDWKRLLVALEQLKTAQTVESVRTPLRQAANAQ
jgi:hypothetical protein